MLLTILARMSNDKQRLQLLQTLRNKLSNYNLNWFDIKKILDLFSMEDQLRFDILQFFLINLKNFTEKIDIKDFIDLSNQCINNNNNEYLKYQLFEQIYEKLNIQTKNDFECLIDFFQIGNFRQKVEIFIRNNQLDSIQEQVKDRIELSSYPKQIIANNILTPTTSIFQEYSLAPLKRKYSFDNEYDNDSCQQILLPTLTTEEDELFIQQRDIFSSTSISSSNSSLSSTSDENIPIRTRSFMIAIKNTFERLKETSS